MAQDDSGKPLQKRPPLTPEQERECVAHLAAKLVKERRNAQHTIGEVSQGPEEAPSPAQESPWSRFVQMVMGAWHILLILIGAQLFLVLIYVVVGLLLGSSWTELWNRHR